MTTTYDPPVQFGKIPSLSIFPAIQEGILFLPLTERGRIPITER